MIPAGPDAARQVSRHRRRVRLAFVATATILAVAVPGVAYTLTTPGGDNGIGSDPSVTPSPSTVDPSTSSSPPSPPSAPSPSANNNLPDASPSATVTVPVASPSRTS